MMLDSTREKPFRIFTKGLLSCTLLVMRQSKTNTLTAQQRIEVQTLQDVCFEHEQLQNKPLLSNELNTDQDLPCFFLHYKENKLVGFLAAFFPTDTEVEITGFVHPAYRRGGIFSSLVAEARKTYQGHRFLQMLLQVESTCASGKAYIHARAPLIDRTEYLLVLSKSRWLGMEIPRIQGGTLMEATGKALKSYSQTATRLLKEDASCISKMVNDPTRKGYLYLYKNKPLGVLQSRAEDTKGIMLHGIAIDEAYRGQGHGRTMLALALDGLFRSSVSISLEVDAQNPRALGLYRALGFEIDFQVDYHALNLSYL